MWNLEEDLTVDDEDLASVTYVPLLQQALMAMQSLNPVERAVLGLRFGLDDGEERDLEAVAKHYGVAPEIIQSVKIDALRKLKNPERFSSGRHGKKKRHLYLVK